MPVFKYEDESLRAVCDYHSLLVILNLMTFKLQCMHTVLTYSRMLRYVDLRSVGRVPPGLYLRLSGKMSLLHLSHPCICTSCKFFLVTPLIPHMINVSQLLSINQSINHLLREVACHVRPACLVRKSC